MIYPFRSFILAVLIYLIPIFFLTINFKNNIIPPFVSLEIEAEIIGDSNQHQHNSSFEAQKTTHKISIPDAINQSQHQHLDKNFTHQKSKLNEAEDESTQSQKISPIYQPLPDIPEDLRYELFSSKIIAKFFIAKSGEVSDVELIKSSHIPRLNMALINTLKKWRFPPQNIEKTEIIAVKFAVTE